jgi:hypothetical protein
MSAGGFFVPLWQRHHLQQHRLDSHQAEVWWVGAGFAAVQDWVLPPGRRLLLGRWAAVVAPLLSTDAPPACHTALHCSPGPGQWRRRQEAFIPWRRPQAVRLAGASLFGRHGMARACRHLVLPPGCCLPPRLICRPPASPALPALPCPACPATGRSLPLPAAQTARRAPAPGACPAATTPPPRPPPPPTGRGGRRARARTQLPA